MTKPFFFLLLLFCIVSCELRNETMDEDMVLHDSAVVMAPGRHQPLFDFNSFSYADTLSGCACYFSVTKNIFANQQYIFVAALELEEKSYMQFSGKWVEFALDSLSQRSDSLYINVSNDSLHINVKTLQDSITSESILYQGELQIVKEGVKDDFKVNVYGKCVDR